MSRKTPKTDTPAVRKPTRMELVTGAESSLPAVPVVPATPEKTAYERFEEYVVDLLLKAECYQTSEGDPSVSTRYNRRAPTPTKKDLWLYVEWETGGVSGGSCWGGENRGYSTGNAPEELLALDLVLNGLRPNITYIQYKLLAGQVMKTDTRTQDEYYGNHTDYAMKKVRVRDLFEYCRDQRWELP